jgi:hypothetical protein
MIASCHKHHSDHQSTIQGKKRSEVFNFTHPRRSVVTATQATLCSPYIEPLPYITIKIHLQRRAMSLPIANIHLINGRRVGSRSGPSHALHPSASAADSHEFVHLRAQDVRIAATVAH